MGMAHVQADPPPLPPRDGSFAPIIHSVGDGWWREDRVGSRVTVEPVSGVYALFLDDIRLPPDENWLVCRTIDTAKGLLAMGLIASASLDHDLGACKACIAAEAVRVRFGLMWDGCMAHCPHVGTGYDLCLWMAETGHWPMNPPTVHSMNPVGAARMRGVIARYFGQKAGA